MDTLSTEKSCIISFSMSTRLTVRMTHVPILVSSLHSTMMIVLVFRPANNRRREQQQKNNQGIIYGISNRERVDCWQMY